MYCFCRSSKTISVRIIFLDETDFLHEIQVSPTPFHTALYTVAQRSNCGFRATHNVVSHELRGILMIAISAYGDDLEDKASQDRPLVI